MLIMIMFFIILSILLVTPHVHTTTYTFIHKYNRYAQLFKANAGQNNTLDLTHLATGKQICDHQIPCKFYVYLYQPPLQPVHTVLLTSGIHGNQKIGPTALLHAYPLLNPQSTRIIYFPIMNPSGYDLNQRNSFPEDLDLNRDYPIDKNMKCYEGSSTRIIDHLFRSYKIDLTVNLHNGGDQIGWNWGTFSHKNDPQTQNQQISVSIGSMLRDVGGQNQKLHIKKFKIGTMNQAIYPAIGTLDDWAYAGSWDQSVPPSCQKFNYKPYQKQMHSGLVFLFELGKHNPEESLLGTSEGLEISPHSNEISNGYVTRALRMLSSLVKVIEPNVTAGYENGKVLMKIQGCKSVDSVMAEVNKDLQQVEAGLKNKQLKRQSSNSDNNSFHEEYSIDISQTIAPNTTFSLAYSIRCNGAWKDIGSSFLAKGMQLKGNFTLNATSTSGHSKSIADHKTKQTEYYYILIPVGLFICFVYVLFNKSNRDGVVQVESIQTIEEISPQTVEISQQND